MNLIQMDLSSTDAAPSVNPFQGIVPTDGRLVFHNLSWHTLKISFQANHAFAFPSGELVLPSGQMLKFSPVREWNFVYTISAPDRPRARAAIITVIQPVATASEIANLTRFVFSEPGEGLKISPLQAEMDANGTVVSKISSRMTWC